MTATYNARPGQPAGTVARVRFVHMSATKARAVLDLIRGAEVTAAGETLRFCERDAALVIAKLLRSAIANAEHNDDQIVDDLVVSACWADEGRTIRRFRPRARGRATRIRKRTCHITIVVSRMTEEQLERRRHRQAARPATRASRRAGQEAAVERTPSRTRRRRTKGRGEAATTTPATATTTPAAETPAPTTPPRSEPEVEPDQPEIAPETDQAQPESAPETDQAQPEQALDHPTPTAGTTPTAIPPAPEPEVPEETSQQEVQEVPPQAEQTDEDDGLGLFEDEDEASPEGGQDGAPASDTPPKADNDPGAPRQTPEGTGGA